MGGSPKAGSRQQENLHQPERDYRPGARQQNLACRVQTRRGLGVRRRGRRVRMAARQNQRDSQQHETRSSFRGSEPRRFQIMPKLPYKFSYRFKDDAGVESKLMIEDWEVGQLYWSCEKHYGNDQAVKKVRQKYMDDFVKTKDLYLFLGTTYE